MVNYIKLCRFLQKLELLWQEPSDFQKILILREYSPNSENVQNGNCFFEKSQFSYRKCKKMGITTVFCVITNSITHNAAPQVAVKLVLMNNTHSTYCMYTLYKKYLKEI